MKFSNGMGFLAIGLPIAATETTTTDHLRGLRLSGNEYVNVVGGTDGTAECPEGYIVQEVGYTVTDGDVVNEVLTYNGTVPIGVSITGTGTIVATVSCKYSDIVGTGGGGGSNPGTGIVALCNGDLENCAAASTCPEGYSLQESGHQFLDCASTSSEDSTCTIAASIVCKKNEVSESSDNDSVVVVGEDVKCSSSYNKCTKVSARCPDGYYLQQAGHEFLDCSSGVCVVSSSVNARLVKRNPNYASGKPIGITLIGKADSSNIHMRATVSCLKDRPTDTWQAVYGDISLCDPVDGTCRIQLYCPDNTILQEIGQTIRDCSRAIEEGINLNPSNCNSFGNEAPWLMRVKEREILYGAHGEPIGARLLGMASETIAIRTYFSCKSE